ncbi:MAG: B12-binding domain-containing radical SAM protein [Planctomycetes bacterium]|nr:B12-binding domain-containing radical SAM protein [Planctomycetota bacterium]
MRVALVFNPFAYKLHEENLRIVQRYFGLFPPLSLAWVAAIAEKAGHDVTIIDARTLRLTPDQVLAHLRRWKPDILGFMMTTYMFRETLDWIRYLRGGLKNTPVMVGGYNLRVYPKESVTPPEIDFGCFNSAYRTVPRLLEELEGGRHFDAVPGLIYKRNGQIIQTDYGEDPDFNLYPNPARHLLPNELYAEFPTERKNFTVMVTSKGCPMGCLFCEAGQTRYNPRSPQVVVDEMQECCEKYGIREIDIFDYEFLINRKRALAIFQEMRRRRLDLTWACRARIDSVDDELLREMAAAGCGRIYYGIEFGIQEMLNKVNKRITIEQVRESIRLTRKHGIRSLGFFLVGGPGETRQSVAQTLKFAKSLNLDYAQFSKVTAKPLTQLWCDLVRQSGYDYWREYILGNAQEQALPRPWTQLTNDEIDQIARSAYIKYHSRPFFLLRHTLKVRSWAEFKRKFFAYLEMAFKQEKVSKPDHAFKCYGEDKGKLEWYKKISKWSTPF